MMSWCGVFDLRAGCEARGARFNRALNSVNPITLKRTHEIQQAINRALNSALRYGALPFAGVPLSKSAG